MPLRLSKISTTHPLSISQRQAGLLYFESSKASLISRCDKDSRAQWERCVFVCVILLLLLPFSGKITRKSPRQNIRKKSLKTENCMHCSSGERNWSSILIATSRSSIKCTQVHLQTQPGKLPANASAGRTKILITFRGPVHTQLSPEIN